MAVWVTLEEVMEFYDGGGRKNPNLDPEIRSLQLNDTEKEQLEAFLRSLSGQVTDGLQSR